MLRICCPFCGERDEAEFRYRGDATVLRPQEPGDPDAFLAYVYQRENPRGWQVEWWQHSHGCRRVLKVVRNTLTHEVKQVGWPDMVLQLPEDIGGA